MRGRRTFLVCALIAQLVAAPAAVLLLSDPRVPATVWAVDVGWEDP